MKFLSWNVNGLRACMQKGFPAFFDSMNADFFCLQETKLQEGQIQLDLPGYEQYWCYAEKKGYSGTAIFTKHTPQSVRYGMGIPELDTEGRLITLEYPEFYLVTCYTPNAQRELARIGHRMKWEDAFRRYLCDLDAEKPVILCGDLNVAHKEIDLKNPASNRGSAGFSDQEREAFSKLLDCGFTDTFRYLNPDVTGAYTWWSYMYNARKNNAGWRIDYFVVSDRLKDSVYRTPIHSDVLGSDHCPVELDLDISCNGSIWLSEPEGNASEIKPEKEPLSGAAKTALKAGAAAAVLVLGLAAGSAVFPSSPAVDPTTPSTGPVEPPDIDPVVQGYLIYECDFLKIYTYTEKPETIWMGDDQYVSSVAAIAGFADSKGSYLFTEAVPTNLRGITPNCFLRLELTELGKQYISGPSMIQLLVDGMPLDLAGPGVDLGLQRYGTFDGWFLYGRLTRTRRIQITLNVDKNYVGDFNTRPITTDADLSYYTLQELADYVLHDDTIWGCDSILDLAFLQKNTAFRLLLTRDDWFNSLLTYIPNGSEVEKLRATELLQIFYDGNYLTNSQKMKFDEITGRYFQHIQVYGRAPLEFAIMPPGATNPEDMDYMLQDGNNSYLVTPPDESQLAISDAVYWLRIDLSEFAKGQYHDNWQLYISESNLPTTQPVIRPYYEYNRGLRLAGWFLYGSTHTSSLSVVLSDGSNIITHDTVPTTLGE